MRFVLFLSVMAACVSAHMRLKCPSPRDVNTGLKRGPCGTQGSANAARMTLSPGWQTIVFEESISHTGAPFRLALAPSNNGDEDEDDFEKCVLLDHIPHHDNPTPQPTLGSDATYVPYAVSVFVPDINCPACTLQIINPMTDKVNGQCRFDEDCDAAGNCQVGVACHSVYHSCADVTVTGKGNVNAFDCKASIAEAGKWPFKGTKSQGDEIYKSGESAPYESSGWISAAAAVPAAFYTKAGPCAATVPDPPVSGGGATPASSSAPGTSATPAPTAIPIPEASSADFIAYLEGGQEVPPTSTSATGLALISLDDTTLEMTLHLYHTSTSAYAIHIHGPANVGSNAGVAMTLASDAAGTASPIVGTSQLDQAFVTDLRAGRHYVNVHSQRDSNGEIRGQFFPVASTTGVAVPLEPSAQVAASGVQFQPSGVAMLSLDTGTLRLRVTAFHGAPTADSVVLRSMADASFEIAVAEGRQASTSLPIVAVTRPLSPEEERAFRSGAFTVSVRTAEYPTGDGAMHGQASAPPAVIEADPRLKQLNTAAGVGASTSTGTTTVESAGGKSNKAAVAFAVVGWLALVGVIVAGAWWYFTKRLPSQRLKEEQHQLGLA